MNLNINVIYIKNFGVCYDKIRYGNDEASPIG